MITVPKVRIREAPTQRVKRILTFSVVPQR